MKSYKVYYINLDKSIERRNFMENQFKELNIPLTRMTAVYGKELPQDFLKKAKSQFNIFTHYPNLNEGEIGLTKTYFDLWQIITKQKEDYAIVLEDDALLTHDFFPDLDKLLQSITVNDFLDISGRKGFLKLNSNNFTSTFTIPSLQTTGQIIGRKAAKTLSHNSTTYYSPIDVLKQDVYKHKVKIFTTIKKYVSSNDENVGGTTIQQKKMPKFKKVLREIIRPFWQILTLFTYKLNRITRNYIFYMKN
jgi:glycosyl transferase family 25